MKRCNDCNVNVDSNAVLCPLCANALKDIDGKNPEVIYPKLVANPSSYKFLMRLLIFISVITIVVSVIFNFFINPSFLWSAIVVAGIVYFWIAISNILRRNTNPAFKILVQVLMGSILVVIIDFLTGRAGWSFSFVLPTMFAFGIIGVMILIVFNRTNWARYVLYQWILAIFGFIPLILYFVGLSKSLVMSIIAGVLGFASLVATLIFGDRTIKSEFKRRLHF